LLEYILDFNDFYALYPIYAGIIVGLILKSIWVLVVDDSDIQSFSSKLELTIPSNDQQIQKMSRNLPNPLLVWLIKFIRNKSGTSEDLASFMFLFR
jgi:hypothetical protein